MSFVLPLIHAILIMRRPAVAYQAMSTPLVPQGKSPQGNPHQSWSTFQSHSTAYSHIQPDHDPDAAVEPYSQLEAHHAPYASRGADADFDRQASYNDDIGNEPSYRVSADEAYDDHGPHELGQQSPPSGQHEQQEGLSRRESYSHTRDVRFDSYVARQASTVSRLSERRGSEAGSIGEISPIISRRPSSGSPLGSNPSSRGKSGSGSGSYLPSFSEQLHDRDEWSLGLGIVSEADAPLRGGDMGEQRAFKDVVGMEAVGSPEFKVGDGDAMRILGDDVHQGRNLGTPRIHVEEPVESDDGRSDAGAETRRLT